MKTCYIIRSARAIADLVPAGEIGLGPGLVITRLNVPISERGQGHGSDLLNRITADADKEGVPLFLEISPSDGLNYDQLEEWYSRNGFQWHPRFPSIMFRRPQ